MKGWAEGQQETTYHIEGAMFILRDDNSATERIVKPTVWKGSRI